MRSISEDKSAPRGRSTPAPSMTVRECFGFRLRHRRRRRLPRSDQAKERFSSKGTLRIKAGSVGCSCPQQPRARVSCQSTACLSAPAPWTLEHRRANARNTERILQPIEAGHAEKAHAISKRIHGAGRGLHGNQARLAMSASQSRSRLSRSRIASHAREDIAMNMWSPRSVCESPAAARTVISGPWNWP